MIVMKQGLAVLAAGMWALGLPGVAQAQGNELADHCQISLKNDPHANEIPDIARFCGCIGEKVPAADRAISVTVMKAADEARAKGGRVDPATLPPDQAKAFEQLRGVVRECMQMVMQGAPPAQTPAPAPAPTAGKVTGLAAWSQLVGNTVAGKVEGKDYAEFYLSDGTVKTLEESTLMTGKWSVEGEQVCFVYPKEDKACFAVEVSGDDVTFTEKSGIGIRLKILKGNPKNL